MRYIDIIWNFKNKKNNLDNRIIKKGSKYTEKGNNFPLY